MSSHAASPSVRLCRAAGVLVTAIAAVLALAVAVPVSARAAGPSGPVHGLKGEYYTIDHTTYDFVGAPKATILDRDLDQSSMVPVYQQRTGQGEWAGVRWTGFLTAPQSGSYTFKIKGDNGFRLWVDGTQIIDHWVNDWDLTQTSSAITLTAGQRVAFRLDLFQATGGANVHVTWVTPDGQESTIPVSALTVPDDFAPPAVTGAVSAAGTSVTADAYGVLGGVTPGLAAHLVATVDGGALPIVDVATGSAGTSLVLTLSAPIPESAQVRLSYDGGGGVTVDGAALPSFDTPIDNASTYTMRTQWADDVDPDNPLPEYPRPQLVRQKWQNLNGRWQFQAATSSFSVPFGQDLAERVVVPYPVESKLSGVGHHESYMVYRRTFTVPAGWGVGSGQRLVLNFGAVDYHAEVYLNGQKVADHTGGYEAFSVDVTDATFASGPNELVLHVTDTTEPNTPHGKQTLTPSGIFYTPTSGIWQTVWMEPVAAASMTRLDLTPDIDHASLAVQVHTAGTSSGAVAEVVAYDKDGHEAGRASGPASATIDVPIANQHLWSPDDPYLYDLSVRLTDGASVDQATSYVGMRKIEVRKNADGVNRIFLNNVQTFLLSTLDQGFWPDGVYTAPTDEALAWDIQATKDLGFNTIRKHIKVEPARWYYDADRLGMMVWQDMPAGSDRLDAAGQQAYRTQLEGMVEQLKSYSSVIGWVPFNEGWGEWNLTATGEIADWVKQLDPSRLVDAHSGENCCSSLGDSGRGDVIDWHQYTGPAAPQPDATRAATDGEHGGFSLSVPGRVWPGGSVNPYGELSTSAELTAAYVRNTAALVGPAQTYLSGSVYTQLTDVEGEVNGFYTYDRDVLKMDAAQVRAVNRKVIEVGSGARTLPPSATGLSGVAAWSFDEGTGTTSADVTGHGHTLTLRDGAAWDSDTPGGDGYSVRFDGTDDFASALVPELDTTGSYTVQARVRMDGLPTAYATMASTDGLTGRSPFFLQYGTGVGGYAFSFADQRAVASGAPALGAWHQLVGVRDAAAGTLKLYVDGTLGATYSSRSGIASDGTFNLGRAQWDLNGVDYFKGALDEVRVYDVALSAEQVTKVSGTLVTPRPSSMSAAGVVTVPTVTGVRYTVTVDGKPVLAAAGTVRLSLGQTAIVTAVADDGYTFPVSVVTASWAHAYGHRLTTAVPVVSGTAQVGRTLSAQTTGWTAGTVLAYQWRADGSPIKGATRPTLTLAAAQRGKRITVVVTGSKPGYAVASQSSRATGPVSAGVLRSARPRIKGAAKVGKKLKAEPGAWTAGVALTYRWYQNGKPIKGKAARKKSLTLKRGQKGKKITVKVTGTKPGYTAVTTRSKATKKVKAHKKTKAHKKATTHRAR